VSLAGVPCPASRWNPDGWHNEGMPAETDLETLIASMSPMPREGSFVFVTVPFDVGVGIRAEATVAEAEGLTLVLTQQDADARALPYDVVMAWITLQVHSSLSAVGLTAAFSSALAAAGISCNVLAGVYHDHLLVPVGDLERAVMVLGELAATSRRFLG
jgi:uncharacterized protein